MTGVLVPAATEAEWLAARRKGITASEVAVVMGLSPYSSPYALYHQKTGVLPGQDDNDAMALGRYLEEYVADQFRRARTEFWVGGNGRTLYAHEDRPWQLATPDRLLSEHVLAVSDNALLTDGPPLAVLECKTDASYDGWGDDGSDQIPVHYRCQVLWQMDVLSVPAGYVACLFLHSRALRVYELTMDAEAERDLRLMRDTARCFLGDIRDGSPPDVDWRPATGQALKRLHPSLTDTTAVIPVKLAARYRAACTAHKAAEQRKKLAENQIRQRLGTARHALAGGALIATRQVYDVKEHVRKASTTDKLVPARQPKEQPSA